MKKVLLTFLVAVISLPLFAQDKVVSGKVVSADDGEPLPGVNIIIEGTNVGTTTDLNGQYRLTVNSSDDVLLFSYIGFQSTRETVGARTTIDVQLEVSLDQLDEIVITGYGSQVRREVTGSISTVKGEEVAEMPVTNADQLLRGRATGVQISQGSGVPGAPVRILVRGTSSISAGAEPMIVLDGIPMRGGAISGSSNPLESINPNDIESMEVLKDAAATAIYGSRGANGVILITTKKGTKGKGEITFDYNYGVMSAVNEFELAGARDWLEVTDQAWANDGLAGVYDPVVAQNGLLSDQALDNPDDPSHYTRDRINSYVSSNPQGTDWLDPIWRNGTRQQFNFSARRGFEMGQLFVSGQYLKEEGLVENFDQERFIVRTNLALNPTDKLQTGININMSRIDRNTVPLGETGGQRNGGRNDRGQYGSYGAAVLGAPPIIPYRNPDGSLFDIQGRRNTLVAANPNIYTNNSLRNRVFGTVYAQYDIIDGLTFRAEASMDYEVNESLNWTNDFYRPSVFAAENFSNNWNRNLNGVFTYVKKFGDHNINATLGAERQQNRLVATALAAENLTSSDQRIGEPNISGDDVLTFVSRNFPEFRIQSYFARANYAYKDKYLLGLSFRTDGASVFGDEQRWGSFPAISAGWIISEEDFASGLGAFNLLKLRASYGGTGNADIPNVLEDSYVNWPAYGSGGGFILNGLGVPDITWENINSYDVAVDFGLFENRISGSVGYYRQNITDMLLQVPIPQSQGVLFGPSSVWTNFGELQNQGFEFQISSVNIDRGDFSWRTDFNITTNQNEVVRLDENLSDNVFGIINQQTITQAGGQLGTYFMPLYAGIDPATGYEMIYEVNQELFNETGRTELTGNVVTATNANLATNRYIHEGKNGLPTFFGGINNTIKYKDISFSFQFTYQGGNYLYDNSESARVNPNGINAISADYIGNYWTESNRNAKYPRPTIQGQARDGSQLSDNHSRYLYKADLLRLNFVQLSYNLPTSLLGPGNFIKSARVYVNGMNLATFTPFPGLDPEVANFDSNRQNRNLRQGFIGSVPFPQVQTITGGVTLKF